MKHFWALGFLALTGCTSTLVQRVYEPQRGGVVAYLNEGMAFVTEKRRQDGFEKMSQFCSGPYRLIQENDISQFAGTYTTTNANASASTVYGTGLATSYGSGTATSQSYAMHSNYTYMHFVCSDRTPAQD